MSFQSYKCIFFYETTATTYRFPITATGNVSPPPLPLLCSSLKSLPTDFPNAITAHEPICDLQTPRVSICYIFCTYMRFDSVKCPWCNPVFSLPPQTAPRTRIKSLGNTISSRLKTEFKISDKVFFLSSCHPLCHPLPSPSHSPSSSSIYMPTGSPCCRPPLRMQPRHHHRRKALSTQPSLFPPLYPEITRAPVTQCCQSGDQAPPPPP